MFRRTADVVLVVGAATIVIAALAWPVLVSPGQRLFGMDIVGRHHDPFTVMMQFEGPVRLGPYMQPLTDLPGAVLARLSGGVEAYNWLMLVSFPTTAAAAYLLASFLGISRMASVAAAMAYAFSPFHLAQAAYHLHIAQTQWHPLYLLALLACLQRPSLIRAALLGATAIAVVFSNFYGGLIAIVITPFVVATFYIVHPGAQLRPHRAVSLTVVTLVFTGAACLAYAFAVVPAIVFDRLAFAVSPGEMVTYGARWWSYLVPPVEHPLLSTFVRDFWSAQGMADGLLEQQVYIGIGVCCLASIATARWLTTRHSAHAHRGTPWTPVLLVIAVAAFLCSLAPAAVDARLLVPSDVLWSVAPMFRSYARFGGLVQLAAVLMAAIGIDSLAQATPRAGPVVAALLVALTTAEYLVRPAQMWRDTLPTSAHRWVMQQSHEMRVLDCTPLDLETRAIPWLTRGRIAMNAPTMDCTEPNLAEKSAGAGYSALLVPMTTADGRWLTERASDAGLQPLQHLSDGTVFDIASARPVLYVSDTAGFSRREHDRDRSWQWMGPGAAWTLRTVGSAQVRVTLDLELASFHEPRILTVRLDGRTLGLTTVGQILKSYAFGPFTLAPGTHVLTFTPTTSATVASSVLPGSDHRPLSFMFGNWTWVTQPDVAGSAVRTGVELP